MSTPTDVEVQLSPEGDPLGIIWQRPDYRAAELTSLTTKLLERVADDVATRVREEMRRVLADSATYGHHPRETARALQEAYGEVLQSTLSRMLTIARTEQLDAYRAGQRAAELANAQVITGWEWHSVLGTRSCRSCIGMHGTMHPIEESGPDDHPNGRCYRVPRTKTWRELGFDIPERRRDRVADADKWFTALPEAEQRSFLGQRGYESWAAGKYPRSQWSRERENPGWRRSYVPTTPPKV